MSLWMVSLIRVLKKYLRALWQLFIQNAKWQLKPKLMVMRLKMLLDFNLTSLPNKDTNTEKENGSFHALVSCLEGLNSILSLINLIWIRLSQQTHKLLQWRISKSNSFFHNLCPWSDQWSSRLLQWLSNFLRCSMTISLPTLDSWFISQELFLNTNFKLKDLNNFMKFSFPRNEEWPLNYVVKYLLDL